MSPRILLVDDDDLELEECADALRKVQAELVSTTSASRAAEMLADRAFDLMITDLKMPGPGGLDLLRTAIEHDPELPVVILTGFPSVDTAVESLRAGAADYLSKPVHHDELVIVVRRLLDEQRVRREHGVMARQLARLSTFDEIVGECEAMSQVFTAIESLSASDIDVLIVGETGTGKELVARAVHERSGAPGPFLPVDCGAIPEHLLESEFFGHERGAFTGAHKRSIGLLEFAAGGSLFLDEVSSLPPALQAKLLRALQERTIRRVGSREEIEVSFRVIAASNEDLRGLVAAGRFREDLYYRLDVGRIRLPPLRERTGDVPILVQHLLARYAPPTDPVRIAPEAMALLEGYPWPGNVRELENVVRRIVATQDGAVVGAADLPSEILEGSGDPEWASLGYFELKKRREELFERRYLGDLMRAFAGDVRAAAEHAQLPRGTLYRLLKKHGIEPGDHRSET